MEQHSEAREEGLERGRRRGLSPLTFALLAAAVGFLCIVPSIILPIFFQAGVSVQQQQCIGNLKRLAAAHLIYATDYNDRLPPAGSWMDALAQYEPDELAYACPVQRRVEPQSFGYGFNRELSGAEVGKLSQPDQTPLAFDSSDVRRNASGGLELLPSPGRHRNGRENNVVYADGRTAPLPRD